MADPSIQTFCCHSPGPKSPDALLIMAEFNSTSYNIVCLVSSILGMMGAIYQLLPREHVLSKRWFTLASMRGRHIIIWLAFSDLLASLGVFMRSIVKLNDSILMSMETNGSIIFCIILSAWIEYFFVATWLWTLFYAVDTWRALHQKPGLPKLYHFVTWSVPAAITSIGLTLLYYPSADCHMISGEVKTLTRLLPNFVATYVVIAIVMVANPLLYAYSTKEVQGVAWRCLGQVTRKERAVVQATAARFLAIVTAFTACWLPNLLNGILLWATWKNLPKTAVLSLWYIMAVMNPLQALFNSIVYRRSNQKIVMPFTWSSPTESTPLLPSNINT